MCRLMPWQSSRVRTALTTLRTRKLFPESTLALKLSDDLRSQRCSAHSQAFAWRHPGLKTRKQRFQLRSRRWWILHWLTSPQTAIRSDGNQASTLHSNSSSTLLIAGAVMRSTRNRRCLSQYQHHLRAAAGTSDYPACNSIFPMCQESPALVYSTFSIRRSAVRTVPVPCA